MKLKKKDWQQMAQVLMVGSALSVLAAGWGFVYSDIVLASTQWLLVAAVLAAFGLYSRLES
ncbi:MAG TPA: hypothetical protein VMX77_02435 [Candidatus Bathyarchaeia archaeon]|nr:hypothetical protein [Candidatus Bathyarchaeia archaeon]